MRVPNKNPQGRRSGFDPWPMHATSFDGEDLETNLSGVWFYYAKFQLKNGDEFYYIYNFPMTLDEAAAFDQQILDNRKPNGLEGFYGEQYNFVIRPTLYTKLTPTEFTTFLNS